MNTNIVNQWLFALALAAVSSAGMAQAPAPVAMPNTPGYSVQSDSYSFRQLDRGNNLRLTGIHDTEIVEFTVRRDQIVTNARLNLVLTSSPSLLPRVSHLRIFLNEVLMQVVTITEAQVGKQSRHSLALDVRYFAAFNRIRIEFVGHYTDHCEDPGHSSLWVEIDRESSLEMTRQVLPLQNNLADFPQPFYDERDNRLLSLPVVFGGQPGPEQQRAAAILASYFGAQAGWRGASFPVSFDLPPESHGIVLATNEARPSFLQDHPKVDAPMVTMISHPDNPYVKLLLILGRNDDDLVQAATALAVGNTLFRGNSVTINQFQKLLPRVPYDAPNWVDTTRPVQFAELIDYPEQLQVSGLRPRPVTLKLNLPPDLFLWRNQGIPMQLKILYTPPPINGTNRANISINSQFIHSVSLPGPDQQSQLPKIRIPLLTDDLLEAGDRLLIPTLNLRSNNLVRFDFFFARQLESARDGTCPSTLQDDVRAALYAASTLDFSGLQHYMKMPDLRAFADSGFPFSRMADLSETVALVPEMATPAQVGTLLDTVGRIGASTGYPALGLTVVNNWSEMLGIDADILIIGPMPTALRERPDVNILLQDTQSWLRQPRLGASGMSSLPPTGEATSAAGTEVSVTAQGPIAAFMGMQSPFNEKRSMVSLLASAPEDYALLRRAMRNPEQSAALSGTVAVLRESGVVSKQVGPIYYIGSLPWWTLVWFHLSDHPVLLASLAALTVVLFAFLFWRGLHWVARRRLHEADED